MNIIVRCLIACVACLGYLLATGMQSTPSPKIASTHNDSTPASTAVVASLPRARASE